MTTYYEIRQRIGISVDAALKTIYKSESRRMAKLSFDEIQRDNPDEYFELIMISHDESCIKFTETA